MGGYTPNSQKNYFPGEEHVIEETNSFNENSR